MDKNYWISTIVVFVVWVLGGFLVHGFWLGTFYETMPNIMRTDAETEGLMHFMLIAHLLMAAALVWIYRRGQENKPWLQQGLRFGVAVALLLPIPTFMIFFTVQQNPAALAIRQALGDSAVVIVVALLAAYLNRNAVTNN